MTKLAGTKTWADRWGVTGDSGTEYVVSRKDDGSWACSCPAWKFHKAPRPNCKHIDRLLLELAGFERQPTVVQPTVVRPQIAPPRAPVAQQHIPVINLGAMAELARLRVRKFREA